MDLRALIVDDEYPAREEIRYHLSRHENIHVVGEAASIKEAMALLSALEYDVVFLDINFPAENGIDLGLEIMNLEHSPLIIYVTAYEKYAVKAFEVNATDYILKPIDPEKFDRSILRIVKILKGRKQSDEKCSGIEIVEDIATNISKHNHHNVPLTARSLTKISAELNGKIQLLDSEEIHFAYIDQDYVMIKRFKDTLFTRYTMASLEEKLSKSNFFRTNRSYLVNLDRVKEISPFFKGQCFLVMADKENSEIPVSRRKAKELKKIFDF
jgi:two-component system LytT family response regulator